MFDQEGVQLFFLCLDAIYLFIFFEKASCKNYLTVNKIEVTLEVKRWHVFFQRRLNLSDCCKNILIRTAEGRKGDKMIRVCFSAWLYLITWLIIFSLSAGKFQSMFFSPPAAAVSILFCCERLCQSPAVFPRKKERPPNIDSIQCTIFQLYCDFFSFPVKTLCITNAIWLAGAIVWKKVGPFRQVSREAFKLSPRSLLTSYRNLLEVLLIAGLDNGVWTFPYSDFLLLSYSIV